MKLYKSRDWLYKRYCVDKLDINDIAKEAGCSHQTIYVYLREFNLI